MEVIATAQERRAISRNCMGMCDVMIEMMEEKKGTTRESPETINAWKKIRDGFAQIIELTGIPQTPMILECIQMILEEMVYIAETLVIGENL